MADQPPIMTIRFSTEERAALERLAGEQDRSMNWVVRHAVRRLADLPEPGTP